ncbi:hypothetical protein M501DRAFT_914052, partial [Patellaria atrata CBS 101060]
PPRALSPPLSPTVSGSPLFQLPREVRARIFCYALTTPQPFTWPLASLASNSGSAPPQITPALLRVNKTVYAETGPLLYSNNKFMFSHPSDCNMFRWLMDRKHVTGVTNICLRIRDRDVRLWTAYLSSTSPSRSLLYDLPNLQTLWIFFRSSYWIPMHAELQQSLFRWHNDQRLRELCLSLEGKTHADVRLICVVRAPRDEVRNLVDTYPHELQFDIAGDARTGFRKLFSVNVALELSPVDPP